MTTEEKFRAAVNVIKSLPKNGNYQPSNDLMLRFYAYYKQATEGPCTQSKPSFWEVVKKAKWEAWHRLGSMPQEQAMSSYVEELKKIVETMSYNENVSHFLESLGSFYETVPQEDLQLLVGDVIKEVASRPSSREDSPSHIAQAFLSNIEGSPASSYNEKTYSPALGSESDSDADEFIDTVEADPETSSLKAELNAVRPKGSMVAALNAENLAMNGNSPKVTYQNKAPVHQNGFEPLQNGSNGHYVNGYKDDSDENDSDENVNGVCINEHDSNHVIHDSNHRDGRSVNTRIEGATSRNQPVRHWDRMNGGPPGVDISEQIREVVVHLQRDLDRITSRVRTLEATTLSQSTQVKPCSRHPTWWPFSDVSPKTFFFLLMWPVVVQGLMLWLKRRRRVRNI